ncbi:type II toxin-antitoxin system PemK/MazF family toxin [Paenibacillus senegalensis]|uniref:type II toxin-antitoxin system PemK/MazF family toxin n=1 Tax=Paenibacillus senegalensis TaxID=1465766 RepID=UPI000289D8CD|nr:type II toxin-antitoxin system PemK/MazF family toxin [Paenibacillus senegalensis]
MNPMTLTDQAVEPSEIGSANPADPLPLTIFDRIGTDLQVKLRLFSECEQVELSRNRKGQYLPHFERRDIVHCKFSGVGSEYSGEHYAVVWEDNPYFEDITVIPATSQRKLEFPNVFSVGRIRGLPDRETTLLVSNMTRISRKRITSYHGKLHPAWESRINQAIAVSFENEMTLESLVRDRCSNAMPENLALFAGLRFRPSRLIGFDPHTLDLSYRLWNDVRTLHLPLLKPLVPFSIKKKKALLKDLFYGNETEKRAALSLYEQIYLGLG